MAKDKSNATKFLQRDKAGTVTDQQAADEVVGRSELMRRRAAATKKSEAVPGAGKGVGSGTGKPPAAE